MITIELLNKMYENILTKRVLTTKELKEIGFKDHDLTKLVQDGTLKRLKRGEYALLNVEKLYIYGRGFIKDNLGKAQRIFDICHEIDPNHGGALFQLFLKNVNNNDFATAFTYLDKLIKQDNGLYRQDYNAYLILLNQLTSLPLDYQNYIANLKYEDIVLSSEDKRFDDIASQNEIFFHIFNHDNKAAYTLLAKKGKDNVRVQDIALRRLTVAAIDWDKHLFYRVKYLIEARKYEEIVTLLNSLKDHENFPNKLNYVLLVTKDLLEIKKTKEIPKIQDTNISNIISAIQNHDYYYALSLSMEHNLSRGRNNKIDVLYLILEAITGEIDSLTISDDENITKIINSMASTKMTESLSILKDFLENKGKASYYNLAVLFLKLSLSKSEPNYNQFKNNLLSLLADPPQINILGLESACGHYCQKGDILKAKIIISIFAELEKLGLATGLVAKYTARLDIKASSKTRKEPLKTEQASPKISEASPKKEISSSTIRYLTQIEDYFTKRDIPSLLETIKFYLLSITKKQYEILVINVLKYNLKRKSPNFKPFGEFLKGLANNEIVLNYSEILKEFEISYNNKNFEKADLLLTIITQLQRLDKTLPLTPDIEAKLDDRKKDNKAIKEEVKPAKKQEENQTVRQPKEPKHVQVVSSDDKTKMLKIYESLADNNGLIILDQATASSLNLAAFNALYYNKAYAFVITPSGDIAVKYSSSAFSESARIHTENGIKALENEDWPKVIEEYSKVYPLKNAYTKIYAGLGLAYYHLNNFEEALKYLTIATGLSAIKENKLHDYTKLINQIKNQIAQATRKEEKLEISKTSLTNNFGITKMRDIAILIEYQGLTFEDACQGMCIPDNERGIIALLLARDCYAREAYSLGDFYLKMVEELPFKSKEVKMLYENIKHNKNNYQSLVTEDFKPLMRARTLEDIY